MTAQLIESSDIETLAKWIEQDEHHKDVDPKFFLAAEPGSQVYKWGDEGQEPLFFVKLENVARVHVQFNPNAPKASNAKGLELGYRWLIANLKKRGYREIIFDSIHAPLIRFCKRIFAFRKLDKDYSKGL